MSIAAQMNAKSQLMRSLKLRAEKLNMRIDQDCMGQIERLISQAVDRMATAQVLDRMDKLLQAEDGIKEFLESLRNQARQLGTFPRVGEKALELAKVDFCPHWPLC